MSDTCGLHRCFLCRHCLPEWKELIDSSRQVLNFKKGHYLFREGDKVGGIYFIRAGALKVQQSWGNGKEVILRFATGGDVVGHRGLAGNDEFPVSAVALESGSACYISTAFLETTERANTGFLYAMMQLYASELQKSEKRMRDLALMSVKGRVAEALLEMREKFKTDEGGYIKVPVTRQDIAYYMGATYETVFRTLTAWVADGIIQTAGKYIRILKPGMLDATAKRAPAQRDSTRG